MRLSQLAGKYTSGMLMPTAAFAVYSAFFTQHQLTSVLSPVDAAFSAFLVFLLRKISLEKTGQNLHFHYGLHAPVKIIT